MNKNPKIEYYKDSLNRKITVHYFDNNAQVEVEGKNVKQVLTLARLDVKKRNEGWKQILETDFEKEKLELMRKLKAYD